MSTEGSFHSVTKKLLQLNHFSQQCPSFRLQCEHCSRSETLCDSKITHRRFGEALVQFCGLAVFSCLTRHVTHMVCVKSDNCIIKLFQPFHNSVTNCTNIFIKCVLWLRALTGFYLSLSSGSTLSMWWNRMFRNSSGSAGQDLLKWDTRHSCCNAVNLERTL